jgi:hypothetical protein
VVESTDSDRPADNPDGGVAWPDTVYRRCARCALWKPQSEFHRSRTGQFSYCRDCRRAYDRRYYHERGRAARLARHRARVEKERAWMAALKEGVPCVDCGSTFPVWVMHWDHLPGYEKVGQVSDLVGSRSRTLVLEELQKCELVCANCHVMRTINRATGCSSAWLEHSPWAREAGDSNSPTPTGLMPALVSARWTCATRARATRRRRGSRRRVPSRWATRTPPHT